LLSFYALVQGAQKHGMFDFYIDSNSFARKLMLKVLKPCLLHRTGRPAAVVVHNVRERAITTKQ
jgi:hypothetical protein